MNILMLYTAIPHTTGQYFERALREVAQVRSCGPTVSDGVLRAWNLESIAGRVRSHDLPCEAVSVREVRRGFPGFSPDWIFFVESGVWFEMPILDDTSLPKACYLIDTHLFPADHLAIARRFDVVFLAQKGYVELFRERLARPVYWLPLAADPRIHRPWPLPESFDVGICASLSPVPDRRSRRLARLGLHFSLGKKRAFLEEMSEFLSGARILFNSAVREDLNMRVFESMAIGKCLLTDPVPGLFDLFVPDVDLVIYDDSDLVDKVRFLLDHPEVRERIAASGRKKTLGRHTYRHRARSLVRILADHPRVQRKGEEHVAYSYV
ncbi:MAG: glycosyltransferase [Nitrospirae bacterium]|nr:glycosyltransferase [Nitrospirota bacterium]